MVLHSDSNRTRFDRCGGLAASNLEVRAAVGSGGRSGGYVEDPVSVAEFTWTVGSCVALVARGVVARGIEAMAIA